ncbi:DNA-binding response OmpR family regulator [Catenulispora sp. MAP12-49]|uniref:response regulator transcription factor n=1 Tax=unclassified Catenulispora TaxID=414885 RepID=UPI003511F0FC
MVNRDKALVIEDAADIRLLLRETLVHAGFEVAEAGTGTQGLDLASALHPDLVTLDLILPDIDGIEVCRRLRTMSNAYLIMLTARTEEADRLIGLEVGADDYMVKPFSPRELRARVTAMLRRPRMDDPGAAAEPSVLRSHDLVVDRDMREVTLAGNPVRLTRTEFDLLVTFMSQPRRVWERETLARQVWRTEWAVNDHVIDVHVANLRHKLGQSADDGGLVRTVRGVGYRFGADVEQGA